MLKTQLRRVMSSSQVQNTSKSVLILVDFDQTITNKDTIGLLGEFGVASTHNPKPWSYFVNSYLEDYRAHRNQLPALPEGSSFKDFVKQLASYKPIEKASLERVSQHKVFENIPRQAFMNEGRKLRETVLQTGVVDALKQYKEDVRIVSLNWSKDWILGYMDDIDLKREQIYSNDILFREEKCTGDIVPEILTTCDKQSIIKSKISIENKMIVYIGDSLGDIGALVDADIGVILGKDSSLLKSLNDYDFHSQEDITQTSHLYRVDNWDQIKSILDRLYK